MGMVTDIKPYLNFDSVRKNIVYRLINTERNADLLEDIPHMEFLDLSIVFHCMVSQEETRYAAIRVHNLHMKEGRKEGRWEGAGVGESRASEGKCRGKPQKQASPSLLGESLRGKGTSAGQRRNKPPVRLTQTITASEVQPFRILGSTHLTSRCPFS